MAIVTWPVGRAESVFLEDLIRLTEITAERPEGG
jgi:hypothetical protein